MVKSGDSMKELKKASHPKMTNRVDLIPGFVDCNCFSIGGTSVDWLVSLELCSAMRTALNSLRGIIHVC